MAKKKNNKVSKEEIKDIQIEETEEEEIEEIDDEVEETEELDNDDNLDFKEVSLEDRIINIEKKSNITLFIVLITCLICVILLFGVFNGSNNNDNYSDTNANEEVSNDGTYDTSAMKEITAKDIESESKKQTIVIVIGRQGCGYCAAYVPIITEVAKEYGITLRYIDFSKIVDVQAQKVIDEEAYEIIYNLEGEGQWDGFGAKALEGTPNTLIIKDNVIVSGVNGYNEADAIRSAFDAAGLKK